MPAFASHDGAELHYDVLGSRGAAEPIVVLAGGAARHPDYLGDLAGLDSVRTLLLLHQRGVGRSDTSDVPLAGWPDLAHDVEALRVHLDLATIDLLAHSAGTRVALAYVAAYPTHVRRLCLVAPPADYLVDVPDDSEAMVERRRGEPWFSAFEKARPALEAAETVEEYWALAAAAAPLGWATWDDRARAHEAVGPRYPQAATAFLSAPPDPDLGTHLAAVVAPVLVVAGGQDAATGLAPVLALADLFPNGGTAVIDGASHYPWVEQPADFRRAVDAFFTDQA